MRCGALIGIVAPWPCVVLEELIEELFHRRAGRQIGHVGDVRIDLLRRRDIDDGVDHLFGDVGDAVGTPRRRRLRRQDDERRHQRGDRSAVPQHVRKAANGGMAKHGGRCSWHST